MADKRVFVRLAAVGGRQVKAELQGVGEAGSTGMRRLSAEVEVANARLAAFGRRAGTVAAAMGAAMAAASVAMVRSGLQSIDAQAKLAQSLGTTVESLQILERAGQLAGVSMSGVEQATSDMTRRLSQAAASGGPVAAALDRLNLSAATLLAMPLDQRIAAVSVAIEQFIPAAERAAVAGQIFGEEGSIAMSRIDTATLRQATDDVRAFGVVVSEQDADQIERTNDAISRLALITKGMSNQLTVAVAPALERVSQVMASIARDDGGLGSSFKALLGNLDRLAIYASGFATFLAGRWVAAAATASLSIKGLSVSLVGLKAALVRTGIGALIVGAGELAFQFTRLVSGAGGVGAALGLLKDVASQAWNRISLSASAAWSRVEAGWATAQAAILDGFQSATDGVTGWANATINTFEGTFLAVQAIWEALPQVFDRIGALAINGLIGAMESGLAGITEAMNTLLTLGGRRPEWGLTPPDLSEWEVVVPEAANLGERARDAYGRAFEDAPLEAPQLFGRMAEDARGRAAGFAEASQMLANAAAQPITAWQALRNAMTGAGEEGTSALDSANAAAAGVTNSLNEAGNAGAGAGRKIADAGEEAATGWQAVKSSLAEYARSAMDWGRGLGETLNKAFSGAESAFRSFVETGKLDFKGLVRSILADLSVLAFKRAVLGPIANALSGIFGGGAVTAAVQHTGGVVGRPGPSRQVPALAFAAAPRMHTGGWAGLRSDEVPTILQRGERVLSRREAGNYSQSTGKISFNLNVDARGAQAGVAEQIARTLSAAKPEFERLAVSAVANARRRGMQV